MLDLSSTHYQLSNAPSLVPVLKAVLHNFTKQLNEVWWYSLDPVVTSLQPQLSPNPDDKKKILRSDLSSTHHWLSNAPSLVSVRATELSMSQNSLLWCIRTSHIAPVTSLPFRLSGDPHAKKFFWGQIWNVLISSFRTRHRSSPYEEYPLGSHKTLFT